MSVDYSKFSRMSFDQLMELIQSLYNEIDRLTAERKASQDALSELRQNLELTQFAYSKIRTIVKEEIVASLPKKPVKSLKKSKK